MSKLETMIMGKRCKEAIPAGSSTPTAPSIYPNANIEDFNNNNNKNSVRTLKTRHTRLPKGIHFDKDDTAALKVQLDENPKPLTDDLSELFNFEECLKLIMKQNNSFYKVGDELVQLDNELVKLKIQVIKDINYRSH